MTFKNLTTKELFILIFAPVLFLSNFVLTAMLQNIKEFSFVYLNRPLFMILVILIVLYTLFLSDVVGKLFSKTTIAKQRLVTIALVLLATYYVSTFIHVTGQGIFFLNILGMSLGINIILCLIISALIKCRLAR